MGCEIGETGIELGPVVRPSTLPPLKLPKVPTITQYQERTKKKALTTGRPARLCLSGHVPVPVAAARPAGSFLRAACHSVTLLHCAAMCPGSFRRLRCNVAQLARHTQGAPFEICTTRRTSGTTNLNLILHDAARSAVQAWMSRVGRLGSVHGVWAVSSHYLFIPFFFSQHRLQKWKQPLYRDKKDSPGRAGPLVSGFVVQAASSAPSSRRVSRLDTTWFPPFRNMLVLLAANEFRGTALV